MPKCEVRSAAPPCRHSRLRLVIAGPGWPNRGAPGMARWDVDRPDGVCGGGVARAAACVPGCAGVPLPAGRGSEGGRVSGLLGAR